MVFWGMWGRGDKRRICTPMGRGDKRPFIPWERGRERRKREREGRRGRLMLREAARVTNRNEKKETKKNIPKNAAEIAIET